MAKMFYDADADLNVLKGKKIAVIGYGSQGHAHALNSKDSGLDVIVSELAGTANYDLAVEHGFKPMSASEASKQADVIVILLPDQIAANVYKKEIEANIKEGATLVFAHGFNIHYSQIVPPRNVDVVMIAPKGPGHLVRRVYTQGGGVPGLVAVWQDYSGQAFQRALAYAKGIGCTKAGVLETTFKEETETDLFGEQAVLCGGVSELIKAGFDTLTKAGYQPEVAYFECLHELKLIVDLIHESGITGMRYSISDTAEYGDLTVGKRIVNQAVREEMRKVLDDIQSGKFAKEWILENVANRASFNLQRTIEQNHPIEIVGKKLRKMMPWIKDTLNK
jgi:ketol-acid reductoisomerase